MPNKQEPITKPRDQMKIDRRLLIKEFNAKKEDFRDSADLPLWVQTE